MKIWILSRLCWKKFLETRHWRTELYRVATSNINCCQKYQEIIFNVASYHSRSLQTEKNSVEINEYFVLLSLTGEKESDLFMQRIEDLSTPRLIYLFPSSWENLFTFFCPKQSNIIHRWSAPSWIRSPQQTSVPASN